MMRASRQAGFTLVELMVALLIGSVIVLGAGSLFLTTLQTFQKVDELSRKQEAVIFAAHTLSERIRIEKDNYELTCKVKDSQCECTLDNTEEEEPVVTFHRPSGSGCAESDLIDKQGSKFVISLPLEQNGEKLTFQVTPRQPVIDEL